MTIKLEAISWMIFENHLHFEAELFKIVLTYFLVNGKLIQTAKNKIYSGTSREWFLKILYISRAFPQCLKFIGLAIYLANLILNQIY